MLRPFIKCCFCGKHRIVLQQVANYKAPSLHRVVLERIEKHQKLGKYYKDKSISQKTEEPPIFLGNRTDKDILRQNRRTWAKLGSESNIDPATLFPSREEVEEEMRAEEEWWPTLHQMKEDIRIKKEAMEKEELDRWKKIAENMAKMPKWIKQFEEEQKQLRRTEREEEEQRKIRHEKVQEQFGFAISRQHPQFVQYLEEKKIKDKMEKKKRSKQQKSADKKSKKTSLM
uniref:Large ribosomal subunit protein mL64 n=1 Tax=Ciona savignyi TaxID=51511 RepID=H2ZE03_CIOSA